VVSKRTGRKEPHVRGPRKKNKETFQSSNEKKSKGGDKNAQGK
jgi:hypothetical protein